MGKKLTEGWAWDERELRLLRAESKKGATMVQARMRLNNKIHKRRKQKRSIAAVRNKCTDLGIRFHGNSGRVFKKWFPTSKIEVDVKRRLLRGETKVAIARVYKSDLKIPITQFEMWLSTVKGRRSRVRKEDRRSVKHLESLYTDKLNGMTARQIAIKHRMNPHSLAKILRTWGIERQNIMTDCLKHIPIYEIRTKYDMTMEEVGVFRKLARHMDIGNDEDLKPEPTWTKPEMKRAADDIQVMADGMRAMDTEKRFATIQIKSTSEYVCMLCSGDWHYESMFTDQRRLRRDLDLVRDTPDVYIGFCGDAMDGGIPGGPHKDIINDRAGSIKMARAAVRGLFHEIRTKLLWINTGCHVRWTMAVADYNPYEEFARQLNTPYLGPGGIVDLKVNDVSYMGGVMHKFGGGMNKLNAPRNYIQREAPDCDFAIVAHNHTNAIAIEEWAGKQRAYVRSGSYKDVDSYARQYMFTGQEGRFPPCIIFGTRNKEMHMASSLSAGIKIMNGLNHGSKKA